MMSLDAGSVVISPLGRVMGEKIPTETREGCFPPFPLKLDYLLKNDVRDSEDRIVFLPPCRRQESVGCRGMREKHMRQGRGSRVGVFLPFPSQWAWGPLLRVHICHPPCSILDDCKEEADGGSLKLCKFSTRAQWPLITQKGRRYDYSLDGRLETLLPYRLFWVVMYGMTGDMFFQGGR
jgi:hypothetical protein